MAVDSLNLLLAIPRPERPKDELGPIGYREQSGLVDPAMLTDPVSNLNVVGMGILLGKSSRLGLLCGEEALLLLAILKSRRDGIVKLATKPETLVR